jgi:CelD/BcsL family acetyltransferase involved in cellulose biosynthesis
MTVVDLDSADAVITCEASSASPVARVDVLASFEPLAAKWRFLEANGLATPYQTLDWVQSWSGAMAGPGRETPMIVACRDARGKVIALFPLGVQTRMGARVASFLGGKHANMAMGLFDKSAAKTLTGRDLAAIFAEVADRQEIDLFHFRNQPLAWDGLPNPLALLRQRSSAVSVWMTLLQADGEAMVRGLMSSESRKKLRHKERKLGDLGAVSYVQAKDEAEAEAVLAAFLRQKAERFAAMGLANPFASDAVQAFLRTGVRAGLAEGRPAIGLYAMKSGERILAVFGGAINQGRFTGMFTSFDADPVVSRYSPGDLLLLNLIKMMCARGLAAFDLGAGDAHYKNDYCSTEEPLFETLLPMTLKGGAAALAIGGALSAKRIMKKGGFSPALLDIVRKVMRR